MLDEGMVNLLCMPCREITSWKLLPPPRRKPRVRRDPRPRRVLLIDDDRNLLRILQLMLRPEHYKVITAVSADEAVRNLQTADFDVIVSDIHMPGFDGRNLYRFLIAYLPGYTDKVLFLTGDQSEKTLRFLKDTGCPYLFKPVSMHELQSRIREVG
ncbi:MAG: response regulator [Acidobacteria bacterium]|nr:response regulator [Acidobacteriota bacterium]